MLGRRPRPAAGRPRRWRGAGARLPPRRPGRGDHQPRRSAATTSRSTPRGTLNLLEAVRRQPAPPPLLFASTNKVYGKLLDEQRAVAGRHRWQPRTGARPQGCDEAHAARLLQPLWLLQGRRPTSTCSTTRAVFGLPTVVFRMSCIYGPRQFGTEDQGWVAHFLIRALQGEPITIYGDGRQVRDVLLRRRRGRGLARRPGADRPRRAAGPSTSAAGPATPSACCELLELIGELTGARAAGRATATGGPGDQRWYVSDTRALDARHRLARRRSASRRACAGCAAGCATAAGCRACRSRRPRHEGRPGQSALDLRGQHLFRLPRRRICRSSSATAGPCWSAQGHEVLMIDAPPASTCRRRRQGRACAAFAPDLTVVTTAPSYLFWRCAPPELRVPQALLRALDGRGRPHGRRRAARLDHAARRPAQARRRRRGAWASARRSVPDSPAGGWADLPATRLRRAAAAMRVNGGAAGDALRRPAGPALAGRLDRPPPPSPSPLRRRARGPGAEVEASRGCPYHCSFCAKDELPRRLSPAARSAPCSRRSTRLHGAGRRRTSTSSTRSSCPTGRCSRRWSARGLTFGVQTRIDLWKPDDAGAAGPRRLRLDRGRRREPDREGRDALAQGLQARHRRARRAAGRRAKRHVPFVQANLLEMPQDDDAIASTPGATRLRAAGRLGQRSRAAVPLSGLARLPPPVGRCPTTGPGSVRSTIISRTFAGFSDCRMPGRAAAPSSRRVAAVSAASQRLPCPDDHRRGRRRLDLRARAGGRPRRPGGRDVARGAGPAALGAAGGAGRRRAGPEPDHVGPRTRMARPAQARLRRVAPAAHAGEGDRARHRARQRIPRRPPAAGGRRWSSSPIPASAPGGAPAAAPSRRPKSGSPTWPASGPGSSAADMVVGADGGDPGRARGPVRPAAAGAGDPQRPPPGHSGGQPQSRSCSPPAGSGTRPRTWHRWPRSPTSCRGR